MNRGAFNRLLVAVHRYVGLATLVFLLSAALTGCALIFFDGLDAAISPDLYRAEGAGPALAAPALAAIVERENPDLRIVSLPLTVDPGANLRVRVAGRNGRAIPFDEIFVDPRKGAVVGRRNDEAIVFDRHHAMPLVYMFHYELLAGNAGRWFMGIVALLWFLETIVGFYLTLPRRTPFWARWKPYWQVKWKAALPRVLLDLHQASGLWLFAGLVVLSLTSFGLNFYYEAVEPAVLAISPRRERPFDAAARDLVKPPPPTLGFARALTLAARKNAQFHPGLKPAFVTYDPGHGLYGVDFTPSGTQVYRGSGPVAYYFDDRDGHFVFADDPSRDSAGQVLLRTIYPLHSGEFAGWITKMIVFVLGLSVIEMCVSGLIVWCKKRPARMALRMAKRNAGLSSGTEPVRRDPL